MIFDPREVCTHDPVLMDDTPIEQVVKYKYLGIQMDNQLNWSTHVDYLCSKLAQRLHFLRRLRLFGVSTAIMTVFYDAVLGSIIRYGMAVWFGTLTVQTRSKINKLVNTAMKTIGRKDAIPLQAIYEETVLSMAHRILNDPDHLLLQEYELLPSGRRFRTCSYKGVRYNRSFVPASIVLLNTEKKG